MADLARKIESDDCSCVVKSPSIHEQRKHSRDPANDLSEIILDGRKYGLACRIVDISEGGAKLETAYQDLPKRFMLANYTKRTKTLCRLVWQKGSTIGVHFLTKPRPFKLEERI